MKPYCLSMKCNVWVLIQKIAEQFDFGSARAINGIFLDLIGISPFSKAEASKYDQLLNDRNLLVHHAGIYTVRYASQKLSRAC